MICRTGPFRTPVDIDVGQLKVWAWVVAELFSTGLYAWTCDGRSQPSHAQHSAAAGQAIAATFRFLIHT